MNGEGLWFKGELLRPHLLFVWMSLSRHHPGACRLQNSNQALKGTLNRLTSPRPDAPTDTA
jgi:hypothetical protein